MGRTKNERQEDGLNGRPPVSGSRHLVEGGVQTADDRHRIILPVEASSESAVFTVQGVDDVGVSCSPPTGAAQEGDGRDIALGYHASQRRDTHL